MSSCSSALSCEQMASFSMLRMVVVVEVSLVSMRMSSGRVSFTS